jgi:hypothetical protein
MPRILVTGSRHWPNQQAVWDALDRAATGHEPDTLTIVHGNCPSGADLHAAKWAHARRIKTDPYVANWTLHGRVAGPLRNRQMVESGADLCLAFPYGESRGTRGCMQLAEAAGIPVEVVEP